MEHTFVIADVFTRTPFGGNQLAVFPDARGLSDRQMQDLASEFGFSETTFAFPPENPEHTRLVRIFTPTSELPFAGHPTVGTASVLATGGFLPPASGNLILEEKVGPIPVDIDGTYSRFTSTTPFRQSREHPPRNAVTAALSLTHDDVLDCWYGSVGVNFCLVHLTSNDAVDRAALDRDQWTTRIADTWASQLYLFAGDLSGRGDVYARMFAPAFGIDEDPATGSAAAALVASLAHNSTLTDTDLRLHIDQGVTMGRPSCIDATAHRRDDHLTHVTVGGHTTIIGKGMISLPDE
ncbi:PhzF family phenazine biosynthesis protein [Nocardia gipuzkoensis]